MTTLHLDLLAATRGRELRREAAAARLVAAARCCRPSAWARATRRATEVVSRPRTGRRDGVAPQGADPASARALLRPASVPGTDDESGRR